MAGFGKAPGAGAPTSSPTPDPKARASAPVMVSSGSGGLLDRLADGRTMALAVVVVVVAAGGGAFAVTGLFPHKAAAAATQGPSPADVVLKQHPELDHVFEVVKAKFPKDYPELRRVTDELLARNDIAGAAWTAFRFTSLLIDRDAPGTIERAESARLGEFMRRVIELMGLLQQTSPELCARLGDGGFTNEAMRPLLADEAMLGAASREVVATLNAIDSGRTRPQRYAEPAADERAMMGRAVLQQGLTLADAMAYTRTGLDKLPPDKQCSLLLKSFRALRGLPEPARSRFIARAAATATRQAPKKK